MESGKLNRSITIEKSTPGTADSAGTQEETWTKIFTVWAAIRTLRTRELLEQGQVEAEATHEIRIRYRSGITAHHRIRYGSRYFYIVGPPINVDERDRELLIHAKEGTA